MFLNTGILILYFIAVTTNYSKSIILPIIYSLFKQSTNFVISKRYGDIDKNYDTGSRQSN